MDRKISSSEAFYHIGIAQGDSLSQDKRLILRKSTSLGNSHVVERLRGRYFTSHLCPGMYSKISSSEAVYHIGIAQGDSLSQDKRLIL